MKKELEMYQKYKNELVSYILVTNLPETSKNRMVGMIEEMNDTYKSNSV